MKIRSQYANLPVAVKLLSPLLLVFMSLWTAGTLGFGSFARNNLERSARKEIEDLAILLQQDLKQKQESLHLKARWVSQDPDVVKAIVLGDRTLLLRTVLPIQTALNLDAMRIIGPDGQVLVSSQQRTLSQATFQDAAVNRAAQAGLDLSGILLAQNTAPSSLVGLISIKSAEKVLAGLIVGVAIDDTLLQQMRGDTSIHLVAFQGERVTASTLPIDRHQPWQALRSSHFPTRIDIAGTAYLVKTIELSGFDRSTLKIAVLKSARQTDLAERQVWLVVGSFGLLGGLAIAAVTLVGFRTTQALSHRLQNLTEATQQLAQGDLEIRLHVDPQDEVGMLAQSFNKMAEQLIARDRQLSQHMEQLKCTLEELHRTQSQMVQSEKMSALGQMVAGIAHEINNPVNFIYANLTPLKTYTRDLLRLLDDYQQNYPHPPEPLQSDLEEVDIDFLKEDINQILQSMKVGSDRIRDIVLSLRNFSRLDEAQCKPVDIHEGIDNTLMILQHRLKANAQRPAIEVVRKYGDLPRVECYAGQINQVLMNLLANAIDALEESNRGRSFQDIAANPNTIAIRTAKTEQNQVLITISDNGLGIPEAVRPHLFDPFFTTKPVGQGTGLGLSISYQVVTQKHGGKLWCESAPGNGAQFVIEIPIHQS